MNLTWFTIVDCSFSFIPDFVFIQLHSKGTDPVSYCMFTKPLLLPVLFNSSEKLTSLQDLLGM